MKIAARIQVRNKLTKLEVKVGFFGKVIITAFFALAAHVGIIVILAGGQWPISNAFLQELILRWSIAALIAHSISWPLPVFLNAAIIGGLSALNMAFVVLTFQGQFAFFLRALLTNGTGAVGLVVGAATVAMLAAKRSEA